MSTDKMDVSSTAAAENTPSEAEKTKKINDHQKILLRGFRLILQQYLQLQEAAEDYGVVLPEDVTKMLEEITKRDTAARRVKGGEAVTSGAAGANAKKGGWDHARTAAMIDRALANNIEGIKQKPGKDATLKGIIAEAPHMVKGTNFMRSQAVEYNENLSLEGPYDEDKVKQPVELACKLDWFNLPKDCKIDFGKLEEYPGMKMELGDPVKCGCNRETIQAFNKRALFYKVLEQLTMDFERLGSFFSILMESGKAELGKGGADLKDRIKPIFDDLDDVCSMQCNRIAALLYLACQNSRGVALDACGFTGFKKNWMRLAHASKVLFEPGKTDKVNQEVKAGRKSFPQRRPFPEGGDYRGGQKQGRYGGGYGGPSSGGYGAPSGGGSFMSDSAYGYSGRF